MTKTRTSGLLTVPDLMAAWQVSRHSVYKLIRSGQLRSLKIGRLRRIPVEAAAECLRMLGGDR
ncbi:hypothetical protein GCM10027589_06370 [Actinocorallia lasiicapitis]